MQTEDESKNQQHNHTKRNNGNLLGDLPNKKKKFEKVPTVEELNTLKETEQLFNNSSIRFLIKELITKTTFKNKQRKNLSVWLNKVQSLISEVPEHKILFSSIVKINKPKSAEDKLRNSLAKYKNLYQTDNDVELLFTKPEKCENFGLYINNCLPGPALNFNIAVVMPRPCFHVKDFLNNRYLTKRYYYLAYIAEKLKESDLTVDVSIGFHEENNLLPVLKLVPSGCNKTTIKVYAIPEEEVFKPNRFSPLHNNIKIDLFNMNISEKLIKETPTILYNSTLGHDVTLSINNKYFQQMLQDHVNIQEGIKLLLVWLTQRALNFGMCSLSDNLILYFTVYLLSKRKINKYMSSYQVVRNFWGFHSSNNLLKNPLTLADIPESVLDSFKDNFDIICLDRSGYYNYAAFLNVEIYQKFRTECRQALEMLDNLNNTQPFLDLFLIKQPFYLQYDLIIDLSDAIPLDNIEEKQIENNKYIGYRNITAVEYIIKILRRAFNKRAHHIVPRLECEGGTLRKLFIGINLNPEEAFNTIEKGPDLHDFHAAAKFTEFWGELSSNRRFKDGSVKVAVVFRANTVRAKRNVIHKIVDFILEKKLQLKYRLFYNNFDEFVQHKSLAVPFPSGTNEEITLKVINISDDLERKLRSLDLPLKIVGVQGASDIFCFTEIFPPIPTVYEVHTKQCTTEINNIVFSNESSEWVPCLVQPVQCVLQLEYSSKWPNDLEALRHLKTSFYLKIADKLATDHNIPTHVTLNFMDVLYQGLVFRYQFYIPKETGLLKRDTENGLTYFRDSLQSSEMEMTLNVLPKVISALKGLNSQHPSFGLGTCIMKRWLRSQLLDNSHMSDIVLDLLNASLFLNNQISCSPQLAFLRFLKFFVEFPFSLQTVVVNFNEDITKENISSVEEKLQKNRQAYPALYIITSYDQQLSIFTRNSPTEQVLTRIKALSENALQLIESFIMKQSVIDFRQIFASNTEGYDVIIHFKSSINSRKFEQINPNNELNRIVLEKYKASEETKIPIVSFDPIQRYLQKLRNSYGKFALFFHDTYGGEKICVLFYPHLQDQKIFKVDQVDACKLSDEESKVVFNLDTVIEDFYVLGSDLINDIEIK